MSEENNIPEENLPAFVKAAPELLPVWDWWKKEGKSTLMLLVGAAVVVGAVYGYRDWSKKRDFAANQQLVNAYTIEELETAVADYGSSKVGPSLRLRLAKAYYDAERYQDALNTYDVLAKKSAANAAFADIAVLGRGHALEGLAKYKEAQEIFAGYAKANTNSYLALTAQLGAVRCQALLGDKDGAVKELETLKAARTDEMEKNQVERLTDVIKRYDPSRASRSILDAANEAAKALDAAAKPAEAKPAEAPAAPAPAPEAKPAEAKPAEAPAAPAPAPEAKPAEAK